MSIFLELQHLSPLLQAVGILGPLALASVAAFQHLKLKRQLREQVAAHRSISMELRKLSTAVEQSPASIVITDRQGNIDYVNPAFCRVTGYALHEALGQNPRILMGNEQRQMWDTLLDGREWRGELHNRRKDGSPFWEMASISPVRDGNGEISHLVGVKENITERKQLQEQLDQMARCDRLTGLPNRALFFDRLGCLKALSRREGRRFAVLFLDLDGFKTVNDSYGHEAGDAVLRVTAERLTACIRESDTAARMGGDEFAAILGNLSQGADASLVAEKMLQALSAPIVLPDGASCEIGASIGISLYPDDAQKIEVLVSAADAAMHEAKREGGDGCRSCGEAAAGALQGSRRRRAIG